MTIELKFSVQRDNFTLEAGMVVPARGITGIFGPSGSGKTTLLRCMAGLERATVGLLSVDGELWDDSRQQLSRPAHERRIGYVFQEPRLFDHLDVRGNLDYALRRRQGEDGIEFDRVVELLGLQPHLTQSPARLSGGEAQRVAIARALLRGPRLVLMDEPLAALDRARKDEILPFLDRLHAELSLPIFYVSHNIEEIGRLCDHLVVLDAGRVSASGDLQDVLVSMDTDALCGEDAGAIIIGEVGGYDDRYDLTEIAFAGGTLRVAGRQGESGSALRIRVRANDISLCRRRPEQTTILNLLDARIEAIEETAGATLLMRLAVGDERLLARVTRRSRDELQLEVGDAVTAQVKAVAIRGH